MTRQQRMRAVHKEVEQLIEKGIRAAQSEQEAFDVAAAALVTAAGFTGGVDTAIALLAGLKRHPS